MYLPWKVPGIYFPGVATRKVVTFHVPPLKSTGYLLSGGRYTGNKMIFANISAISQPKTQLYHGVNHKEIRYIEWYRVFLMTIWRQHFFGVANVARIRTPSPPTPWFSVCYICIFAFLPGLPGSGKGPRPLRPKPAAKRFSVWIEKLSFGTKKLSLCAKKLSFWTEELSFGTKQ